MPTKAPTIGVFDSGVGGLTVLHALRKHLPSVNFIYLGDTARVPYGTKTPSSVVNYAMQATKALLARNVDYIVVACNTAASAALPTLQKQYPDTPIMGVIEPGALAACAASKNGRIAVLATESTVNGGVYTRTIHSLRPEAEVVGQACQLLVSLAEEGWTEGDLVQEIVNTILKPLKETQSQHQVDCVVLGCTHFPPFTALIQNAMGNQIVLVDSAQTTAELVTKQLTEKGLLTKENSHVPGKDTFLATDGKERFARVGSRFWYKPIRPEDVELIDL